MIYYIADIETNGLNEKIHGISEFSAIRGTDKVQLTRQVKVENPQYSSYDALKITGKTIHDLRNGISADKLIEDFENFVSKDESIPSNRCLVGHNIINFDRKFLWALWASKGKRFPFDMYLDTIHLTKAVIKKMGLTNQKVNLHAACDLFKIKKVAGIHTAISDTRNTYFLWKKLMEMDIDYLPYIKTMPHRLPDDEVEEDLNELFDQESDEES